MAETIVVLTNVADESRAGALARSLVERRLAACVNIIRGVRSVYRWEGKTEEADEVTLLIKSTRDRYAELEAAIRSLHDYDLPEIIALPIEKGLPAYLQWVIDETEKTGNV